MHLSPVLALVAKVSHCRSRHIVHSYNLLYCDYIRTDHVPVSCVSCIYIALALVIYIYMAIALVLYMYVALVPMC